MFVYICLYYVYRLRDVEAKKFFCGYCIKCKCMRYGYNACLIGTYILCCDCGTKKEKIIDIIMHDNNNCNKKPLKMKNTKDMYDTTSINIKECDKYKFTFISFLKAKWSGTRMISDDIVDGSEMSVYSSTSEFLYKQISGYGGHIGLINKLLNHQHLRQMKIIYYELEK